MVQINVYVRDLARPVIQHLQKNYEKLTIISLIAALISPNVWATPNET